MATLAQLKTVQITDRTPVTLDVVKAITKKRGTIHEAQEGQRVIVTVRGNGNVIDVARKNGELVLQAGTTDTVLRKKIYNVVANSAVAMSNTINRELIQEGYKAEKAGDVQMAADCYGAYLNNTQVSISILAGHKLWKTLQDGDDVQGIVQLIEGPNGQVLTLDPSTLSVKEAKRVEKSNTDYFAFMLSEEPTPAAETVPEHQDETSKIEA